MAKPIDRLREEMEPDVFLPGDGGGDGLSAIAGLVAQEAEGEQPEEYDAFGAEDVGAEAPVDPAEDRLQALVSRGAEEALLWRSEELDDEMAENTRFYMGRPFGNEAPGRSRVVSTDVRDTIQAMLPSLMRIFFGPENVVEFEPRGPEDVPQAEQATDYVNYIIRQDNDGFLQIHAALKDALVRKLGVMKYWWEEEHKTEGFNFSGMTEDQLVALQAEGAEVDIEDQMVMQTPEGPVPVFSGRCKREFDDGRVKIAAVPPEEFIFSPHARSREECELMGHVRDVPAAELVAMGIPKELVDEHKGASRFSATMSADSLQAERRFDSQRREEMDEEADESRETVWFGDLYVYADMSEDESGEAELVHVQVIGPNHEIVEWYPCNDRPFALFTPDPEPHTLIGLCPADYVKDVQKIKSAIMRGQLDSLTLSLNPRTEVVEGEVNMADVMNHEVGGIVRVERPGMMREVTHSFIGKEAFPMLAYMDEQKENRTGISKAAAGLDADALQSATKAAVAATLSGAQQHIEMIARVFSETGFKQLYRGVLRLLHEHQDSQRMVRLRNEWVPMDPRSWDAAMDVKVNVALGAGSSEEKIQLLQLITSNQEAQLQQGSPLVSYVQYRNALGRAVELAGFPNADEFFKPWGDQEQQQYDQQKAQEPPSDPEMALVQAQIEIEKQKLALDKWKAEKEHERKVAEAQMDFAIRQATAEAQYQTQISNQEMQADVQAASAIINAAANEQKAKLAEQTKREVGLAQAQAAPAPTGGSV